MSMSGVAGVPRPSPAAGTDNRTAAVVLMASNASGYQEDHGHDFTTTAGLTEKQRIVLACVTALLLAVCAIVIGFVLRRLMKKSSGGGGVYTVEANFPLWRKRSDAASDDACALSQQRSASTSNAITAAHIKSSDDTLLSEVGGGGGGGATTAAATGMTSSQSSSSSTTTTANGGHCIITMTMRNNHLIVETEEPSSDVITAATATDMPQLTIVTDPSSSTTTRTTTTVCDITQDGGGLDADLTDDQQQLAERDQEQATSDATLHSRPGPHAAAVMAGSRTGLSQAVDVNGEEGSPRHPYTYGGGQSGKNMGASTVCRYPPSGQLRLRKRAVNRRSLRCVTTTFRHKHRRTLSASGATVSRHKVSTLQRRRRRRHSHRNQLTTLRHLLFTSGSCRDNWHRMRQLARSRSGIIVLDQMSSTAV